MMGWKKKYEALEKDWKLANRKHRQEVQRLTDDNLYMRGVLRSMSVLVRDIADGEHVDFFKVSRPVDREPGKGAHD